MPVTETAEEVLELTLEGVVESRLVQLLGDAMEDAPDGIIIRAGHETEYGQTPAIVVSAVREGDAGIPGWWNVALKVAFVTRDSELTPTEADAVFRIIDEVMGESSPTLVSTLPNASLAVAGIEYDESFERERSEDTDTRTYSCLAICGLKNPNA